MTYPSALPIEWLTPFDTLPMGVAVIDADPPYAILWINQYLSRLTGYAKTSVLGQTWNWLHYTDLSFSPHYEGERVAGGPVQIRRAHDEPRWQHISVMPWRWGDPPVTTYLVFYQDIQENSISRARLKSERNWWREQATHDPLTGLLNRLGWSLEWARQASSIRFMALMDVREFKNINDTWGHEAGDIVLKTVADRLLTAADWVVRWGGDEFLLAWTAEFSDTEPIAQKIAALLDRTRVNLGIDGISLSIRASLGFVRGPFSNGPLTKALEKADQALYTAKTQASDHCTNWIVWEPDVLVTDDSRYGHQHKPPISRHLSVGPWIQRILHSGAETFVEHFYSALEDKNSTSREILHTLTDAERTHLKAKQMEHLVELMDPDADPSELERQAHETGKIHALLGLNATDILESILIYREIMRDLVHHQQWMPGQRWAADAFIDDRLTLEVMGQIAGLIYVGDKWNQELYDSLSLALPLSDPIKAWQVMSEHITRVPGIPGLQICVPDSTQPTGWRTLLAVGSLWEHVNSQDLQNRAHLEMAWWQERIVTINYNQSMADQTPDKKTALAQRVRSASHVPLVDERGRPAAVLILYGHYPHQWEGKEITTRLQLLSTALRHHWPEIGNAEKPGATTNFTRMNLAKGEWEWWYHPIIEFHTGHILKWESLARWRDIQGRLWAPADFLPHLGLTDHRNLVLAGLQSIRTVAPRLAPARITLNILPDLLTDEKVETSINQILPFPIVLEVLESGRLNGSSVQTMKRLKARGVEWAIDDFGSGFANLDRLWEGAWSWVKFDRHLWSRIWQDPWRWIPVIGQLVRLCQTLGYRTIFEGVENQDAAAVAIALGFDAGQGYLWGPPAPWNQWQEFTPVVDVLPSSGGIWAFLAFHWQAATNPMAPPTCIRMADDPVLNLPDKVRTVHAQWHVRPSDPEINRQWNALMRQFRAWHTNPARETLDSKTDGR